MKQPMRPDEPDPIDRGGCLTRIPATGTPGIERNDEVVRFCCPACFRHDDYRPTGRTG